MAKRSSAMSTKVRKYLAKLPNAKAQVVAEATGATVQYVHNIRYADKKKSMDSTPAVKKPKWKLLEVSTSKKSVKEHIADIQRGFMKGAEDIVATHHTDMVNEPPHYKMGGIETIDFIEAKQFGYNLGNVVKYISRADLKGSHYEDLLKARWYLNREIAKFSPDTKVKTG